MIILPFADIPNCIVIIHVGFIINNDGLIVQVMVMMAIVVALWELVVTHREALDLMVVVVVVVSKI